MKTFRQFYETPEPEFFGGGDKEALTYCDLDGVLADFKGAAERLLGKKIGPDSIKGPEWKIINATEDFWMTLEFFKSGRKLWNHIRKQDPFILSALPKSNRAWAHDGKMAWIGRHLKVSRDKILLVNREDKKKFAMDAGKNRPNLLIDDTAKNIKEWEAAGGIGILHRAETVDKTIARLKKLGY